MFKTRNEARAEKSRMKCRPGDVGLKKIFLTEDVPGDPLALSDIEY